MKPKALLALAVIAGSFAGCGRPAYQPAEVVAPPQPQVSEAEQLRRLKQEAEAAFESLRLMLDE